MTSATRSSPVTLAELESLIKQVEPGAVLAPPRLLRRVIKHDCKIGGLGLWVPHRKGYVVARESLLSCARHEELGLAAGAELPPFIYLMVRPDARRLARESSGATARKYARILFHLRIDRAMQEKLAAGILTPAIARTRIRQLGMTEFAEIRAVLRHEGYVLPPATSESIYAEFVAVYWTLRRFDPERLAHFFPALRDLAAVDALAAQDIDVDSIYQHSRLPGMDEPVHTGDSDPPGNTATVELSVSAESIGLVDRLQKLFERQWHTALSPLFAVATPGAESQEARLLFDLENACADSEQTIYTVDLVEWAMSLGQLSIRRPLPGHEDIVVVRHLRRARDRVRHVRLDDGARHRLSHLLSEAVEHQEHRIRERFRPVVAAALDEVGLKPSCVVEEIGRAKLIDEVLDRIAEHGRLNIGELRDALSRNQMKLPDLRSPAELVLGDPLIRLNRKLAVVLDGVYRRGEFYMRLLHRLSSIAFGTGIGRLVLLLLILPFGLAFFTMITPGIAVEEGEKLIGWIGRMIGTIEPPAEGAAPEPHAFPTPNLWGVAALGVFYVLLFNVASFRSGFFLGVRKTAHGVYSAHIWVIDHPAVQAFLHNPYWTPFRRLVVWPILSAALGALVAWAFDLGTPSGVAIASGGLTLTVILLNTRLGRDIEETFFDWLLRRWAWFSIDFVPGLLHFIMDGFRWALDAVEQMLYLVNEKLRFRSGENRILIVIKAGLGLVNFFVTYVIRFAVNLLIEPQVNPIKHFPVVTVSHKICLPMIPTLADILRNMGAQTPTTTATGIVFGIPGIFGFMVWELKENWKLYRSNRPLVLKPIVIGSHGETMRRLLHPGFHSGTIPKLYQKLRRAERHGRRSAIRKAKGLLHHVEESIAHFIEREMLALLRRSDAWNGLPIELGAVRLATNRVLVELRCPTLGDTPLIFAIDHHDGWLLAGVLERGWFVQLNAGQQQALICALTGIYKLAGVDLTREQLAAKLPPDGFAYEINENKLMVRTSTEAENEIDLTASEDLLLSNIPLPWSDWVKIWEGSDVNGKGGIVGYRVI